MLLSLFFVVFHPCHHRLVDLFFTSYIQVTVAHYFLQLNEGQFEELLVECNLWEALLQKYVALLPEALATVNIRKHANAETV